MYTATLCLSENLRGYFGVYEDGKCLAEMEFRIHESSLVVSGIRNSTTGDRGVEYALFNAMVQYARENYLMVSTSDAGVRLCLLITPTGMMNFETQFKQ